MRRIVIVALALCLALPGTVRAQEDFSNLKLKVGSHVRVTEDGLTLEGPIAAMAVDGITVRNQNLRPGPALRIERDRGHTGLKGMAIGAAIGAAIGLAAAHGSQWGAIEMFPGAFWGGIVGVSMDRYVPVYDTTSFAPRAPQLTVAPPAESASTPIFSSLRAKIGDRVFVTQDGVTVTGTIDSLSPSRLVVGSYEFASGTALKIEKDGDPIWDGAATGFFVGVLLGSCSGCNDCHSNVLASGLVWSGIGALIDWAHKGKTIYDSATKKPTQTARLAPLIDSHRKGVVLTLTQP